jgi:hypothetical protein
MRDLLDGCRAKLKRARKHTDDLLATIGQTRQPGQEIVVPLVGKHDIDRQTWVVMVGDDLPGLPIDWGVIATDAIFNYRSCLDLLMWELAVVDRWGLEPASRTQFPIYGSIGDFDADPQGWMKSISDPHRAMLRKVQPDFDWKKKAPHPLLVLLDLSNDSKHRVVQPVFAFPMELGFTITSSRDCEIAGDPRGFGMSGRPLKPGAILVELPIKVTGAKPYVGMEPDGSFQVGLRNGLAMHGVLKAIDLKVGGIVEILSPEFETTNALAVRAMDTDFGRFHETDPGGWEQLTVERAPPEP